MIQTEPTLQVCVQGGPHNKWTRIYTELYTADPPFYKSEHVSNLKIEMGLCVVFRLSRFVFQLLAKSDS
jgi:hypothetical protein